MNVKMINGNILTQELQEEKKGFIIPETERYKKLKVVNSSTKEVVEGSTVYIPLRFGTKVKIEDKDYVAINVRDIILII